MVCDDPVRAGEKRAGELGDTDERPRVRDEVDLVSDLSYVYTVLM